MRQIRQIIVEGETATIILTQGYRATIDACDVPKVEGRNWSALVSPRRRAVYAVRVQNEKMILLHRLLMNAASGEQVDHKDGDGLNCRRSNMRICTHADNQINKAMRSDSSNSLKGICFDKRAGRWKAEIMYRGTRKFLGHFESPEAAHQAYCTAAINFHGEFARTK